MSKSNNASLKGAVDPAEAAAVALFYAQNHRLRRVVLNKILFYADLSAILETGTQITSSAYVALEHGPVAAYYEKRIVKKLVRDRIAEESHEGNAKILALRDVQRRPTIDRRFDECLKRCVQLLGSRYANDASDYSHDNLGWKKAWAERGPNGQPKSIDMMLAIQQIADDDDWVSESLTDVEQSCVDFAASTDQALTAW